MRKRYYLGCMLSALFGFTGMPNATMAADSDSKAPTLEQVLTASGIELSGFVDTSATYNNNGTANFTSGTSSRAYDVQPHSFNVQMMELAIAKEPTEGFGGKLVLNAGPDANVDHSYPMGNTNSYFDFQQAYVSYQSGAAKLIVGKFSTLIGAEVIESPDNWNFSRSWGFELGPYTHTGARFTYTPSDQVSLTLGINNGWDILAAARKAKSFEGQITFAPSDPVYLSVQATTGQEVAQGNYAAAGAVYGTRTLFNTVDSWDINDQVSVMVDAGYGSQQQALSLAPGATATPKSVKWWYITPYLNYHISDMWRIALRGQYFDDKDGFRTGVAQKLKAGTITVAYAPNDHGEVRAEYRYDKSNVAAFQSTKNAGLPKSTQSSAALEFIYKM